MSKRVSTYKCNRVDCAMWDSRMLNKCDALSEAIADDCPFFKTDEQLAAEKLMFKKKG